MAGQATDKHTHTLVSPSVAQISLTSDLLQSGAAQVQRHRLRTSMLTIHKIMQLNLYKVMARKY